MEELTIVTMQTFGSLLAVDVVGLFDFVLISTLVD
jgi:hypothetical protein